MTSKFLNSILLTKEKAESLKKIRIIKTNLVHVHGFPKSLAKSSILKSPEYFGQYGTIVRSMINYKVNPDNNRRNYSAYFTYSNEREAALAILCVDSIMIKGKIIRAFFGTTKYCSYFLNNSKCPNSEKCFFLHQLATDKDIILDSERVFSYNQHLNLSKKILKLNIPENIEILKKMEKPKKNVFPFVDFIFMSEEEKENYFAKRSISYIKNFNNRDNGFLNNVNNDNFEEKHTNSCNNSVNNVINTDENNTHRNNNSLNEKDIYINENKSLSIPLYFKSEMYINKYKDPLDTLDLPKIFSNSIKHILLAKPYFNNINDDILKKMEFEYFKKDLMKQGININYLLNGCLDCINRIIV